MNYSFIPQKTIERLPILKHIQICPNCGSTKSFPLWNCVDSPRQCKTCKNEFSPIFIGYKDVIVEK